MGGEGEEEGGQEEEELCVSLLVRQALPHLLHPRLLLCQQDISERGPWGQQGTAVPRGVAATAGAGRGRRRSDVAPRRKRAPQ